MKATGVLHDWQLQDAKLPGTAHGAVAKPHLNDTFLHPFER